MNTINMTGRKVGKLTVVQAAPPNPTKRGANWECLCECGTSIERLGIELRVTKYQHSCGCAAIASWKAMGSNPEYSRAKAEANVTHGHKRRGASTPEYKTWLGMKSRCYTPSNKDYPKWGGRGITVCERWRHDFAAFLMDMGPKPTPAHTIDRLRSGEGYGPDNCRWATIQEQGAENRRGIIPVTVGGVTFSSLKKACEHFGVSQTVANMRMRAGIPPEVAVSTVERMRPRRDPITYLPKDHPRRLASGS